MIVVEGPDGAGKTTLCNMICTRFHLETGKRGTDNRDELWRCTRDDTWRAIYEELKCDAPPLVWDRLGPWSDPIYHSVVIPPRPCQFTQRETTIAWGLAYRLGLVVICLPPLQAVIDNVAQTYQMPGVETNIETIYRKYRRLAALTYVYDYTDNPLSLGHIMTAVSRYLRKRKDRECLSLSTTARLESERSPQEGSY